MFKKLVLVMLGIFIVTSMAFAGTDNRVIIDAVTLDADPTSAASVSVYMQDSRQTSFFVDYDEIEVGGVSATVTAQVSYDNINWLAANFYDYDGTSTLQTSEILDTDCWYYFWLNPDLIVPFARIRVVCNNCDVDDNVDVSVYEVVNK